MMNYLKKVSLLLLCSLFVQVASWAQQVQVSPVPQSVSWGEKAFESANAKYSLTKAETTDAYAVALLQEKLTLADDGISLVVGKKGEAAVSAVEANIPETAEGYYLKVDANGIIVAGADNASLYFGTYQGHGQAGNYNDGVELHKGLNVVATWEDKTWSCIYYTAKTMKAWDGSTNLADFSLADFPDLTIHIEGGNINGFYNAVGDDRWAHDAATTGCDSGHNLSTLATTLTKAYGAYWTYRNDDLYYILQEAQYRLYSTIDYFLRPIKWLNGGWHFTVCNHYRPGHYYYKRPVAYVSYCGNSWAHRKPGHRPNYHAHGGGHSGHNHGYRPNGGGHSDHNHGYRPNGGGHHSKPSGNYRPDNSHKPGTGKGNHGSVGGAGKSCPTVPLSPRQIAPAASRAKAARRRQ